MKLKRLSNNLCSYIIPKCIMVRSHFQKPSLKSEVAAAPGEWIVLDSNTLKCEKWKEFMITKNPEDLI
jgi:hypothetical protein